MIDYTTITSCGECCIGCAKKENGICPGCIEAEGKVPEWAESGVCRIYACCQKHQVRFCGLCDAFPCQKLPQMIFWNPDIVSHLSKLRDEYQNQMMRADVRNNNQIAALDQCFVHTDIGPHNTILGENGEVAFIDMDDAGIGSRYLDLGWPFIMQFVDFDHDTEKMHYRFDLAQSFLRGYYAEEKISREEYDLLFQGAVQMHISYMQVYGPDAVDSLWKILLFGMEQKEPLWEMVQGSGSPRF